MDPVTLKLILGGAQAVGGLGSMLFNRRPKYKIPDSLKRAVAIAESQALNPKMPGYDQAETNIQLSLANAIRSSQEGGNAQIGFQGQIGAANTAMRDLAATNEQAQQQDEQMFMQMLQQLAQAEDTEFQMNEFAPYKDRARESRDVFGAGIENLMGGITDQAVLGEDTGVETGMNASSSVGQGASVSDYDKFIQDYIRQNAGYLMKAF